ncbi:DUF1289 domain-containing protein [Paraburkholderia sediminicola]|uniref:DUF1289 domain-containing protein n=1 Tax=Paraburkholderia sediminicola TaxID=458836 RepID=UPI0038B84BB4
MDGALFHGEWLVVPLQRQETNLCVGCVRTLDEIRAGKKMTDHRRYQVINDRARRQAKLQRKSSGLPAEPSIAAI